MRRDESNLEETMDLDPIVIANWLQDSGSDVEVHEFSWSSKNGMRLILKIGQGTKLEDISSLFGSISFVTEESKKIDFDDYPGAALKISYMGNRGNLIELGGSGLRQWMTSEDECAIENDGRYRTLVKIIGIVDDLAYCIFSIVGRHIAIAVPKNLINKKLADDLLNIVYVGSRFYAKIVPLNGLCQLTHEDFDLQEIELLGKKEIQETSGE